MELEKSRFGNSSHVWGSDFLKVKQTEEDSVDNEVIDKEDIRGKTLYNELTMWLKKLFHSKVDR